MGSGLILICTINMFIISLIFFNDLISEIDKEYKEKHDIKDKHVNCTENKNNKDDVKTDNDTIKNDIVNIDDINDLFEKNK